MIVIDLNYTRELTRSAAHGLSLPCCRRNRYHQSSPSSLVNANSQCIPTETFVWKHWTRECTVPINKVANEKLRKITKKYKNTKITQKKLPEKKYWKNFTREIPKFLQIAKFPYNTVYDRWTEASMPNTSSIRLVVSIQYRLDRQTDGRTDGQTDGQTHDDSIYRASIASQGKNCRVLSREWTIS